ncbi:hypothetical protein LAJ19_21540 (plasmid) [Deinococcus taeanensis]|uniref:hypothetical protein n=1 Tax=Deinococcus taeanensis TaxID=2737050 RepID=UPI001CDB87C5|nr:hypothetical protein [Deinococcus taeanensis]UBV45510.1 hypothetical protein LAJ19_21540 [Deinococcus taeanensis]
MNTAELASRVQMASLPEAEYRHPHPSLGTLPLAYPEAKLALRFHDAPGVTESSAEDWQVITTNTTPVDLKTALKRLGELYETQMASAPPPVIALRPPLLQDPGPMPVSQSPALPLESTPSTAQQGDLEDVLIYYLGSHCLRALKHAEGPTGNWLRHRGDQDPFIQALDRVRRLLVPTS